MEYLPFFGIDCSALTGKSYLESTTFSVTARVVYRCDGVESFEITHIEEVYQPTGERKKMLMGEW